MSSTTLMIAAAGGVLLMIGLAGWGLHRWLLHRKKKREAVPSTIYPMW